MRSVAWGRSVVIAWRSLARRPAYFAIAVSSLAIALGLATTVIAQIDSLLHPYSPIRNVDDVFSVSMMGRGKTTTPDDAEAAGALRETGLIEDVVAITERSGDVEIGQGIIHPAFIEAPSRIFALLGMQPRLGRLFDSTETFDAGVAVVTDKFWRANFGNATTLEGASFRIDGRPFRVVGVLGREWESSNRGEPGSGRRNDGLWVPWGVPRSFFGFHAFLVRTKPRVGRAHLEEALQAILVRWRNQYGEVRPGSFHGYVMNARPDPLRLRGFQRALIGAAFFILLIASANVGALTLARGVANRRNQALRLALGAERTDLIRDVIAEISILAFAGGAIGLVIAYASMAILTAVTPVDLTWLGFSRPNMNPRVFAGLFASVVVSVTLCAIGPAWFVSRIAPAEPLKDNSGTTTGKSKSSFQILIIGELALAMVLLFGASLIGKTAHKVATFPFGYDPRNVVSIESSVTVVDTLSPVNPKLPTYRRAEIRPNELASVVDRLRGLPGVVNAAWYTTGGAEKGVVLSEATQVLDSIMFRPEIYDIGSGFFQTIGIRLLEGRDFTPGDGIGGAAILDQRSAQRMFPDGSPVGRKIKLGPVDSRAPWLTVVGVVQNAVHGLPEVAELDVPTVIYVSLPVKGIRPSFVIRSDSTIRDFIPIGVATLTSILPPNSWLYGRKWSGSFDSILSGRRFTAAIFATLSLASLVLATAGLFGVLSFAVNQRMREFSLRVALGAQKRQMLKLVFRESFVMALGGTAVGAFAGLYLGFELWDWLWGVYPVDASALVIAECVLLLVTIAGSALPALRATAADPAEVMRAI